MSRLLSSWKQVVASRPRSEPLTRAEQVAAVIGCTVTFAALAVMVAA